MSHIDYRDQLEAEYNEMIERIKKITAKNEEIVRTSRCITTYRKNNMKSGGGIRKESR